VIRCESRGTEENSPASIARASAVLTGLHRRGDRPVEEAATNRLRKQLDHLFTFLDHPDVPATNNLAERQLRPAVIARKISCGNRTPQGAHAWEVLASLAATGRQRGTSFLGLLDTTARLNPPP